jgi:zinc transport system substrate-binding protein
LLLGWVCAAGGFPIFGCRTATNSGVKEPDRINVVVSITPQAYFIARIGGDRVSVEVLVGPGQSPHAYEPTPRQAAALAEADVFFLIGEPFEQQLLRRIRGSFRKLLLVDTRAGVPLRSITEDEAHAGEHQRDEEGARYDEHEPGAADPHIWLSPRLVKLQARTMAAALLKLDPQHRQEYEANLAAFESALDDLDARIAALLAPFGGRELYVFHPSFGYFADAYGLKQVAVEVAGKEPSSSELAGIMERMRRAAARTIFVQPQNPTRSGEALARQLGGQVVVLDPYARDYAKNLLEIAVKISEVLAGEQE